MLKKTENFTPLSDAKFRIEVNNKKRLAMLFRSPKRKPVAIFPLDTYDGKKAFAMLSLHLLYATIIRDYGGKGELNINLQLWAEMWDLFKPRRPQDWLRRVIEQG